MKLEKIVEAMEAIAPPMLAADFDNPGLLIDNDGSDIKKVLVALDCTPPVADEAARGGYDLVITHHPLIFNPIKMISENSSVTAVVKKLIRSNIAFYCAHTNLDIADGGVNDVLASIFGLRNVEKGEPENYARIGYLPIEMSLYDLIRLTNEKLHTVSRCAVANFRNDPENIAIRRVAVLGGAGGGDTELVKAYDADAFITGEIKHNQAIDAQHIGLSVIEAGHFETERVVLAPLINYLQKATFGVEYKMSECERSPLFTF